ncbi:uncharacterized protein [Palaemon carinicauda]|uniref:uncharacterized protein n=1 Tax=Palaemon carinicauda TaxID=392227 RepID=UPI0035B63760
MSTPLQISAPTDAYARLLTSYPEVFRPELRQTLKAPAEHGIYHHIKMTGPPVFAKLRHLAPERLAATKHIFTEMEEMGLGQKASRPWSSPLHIVLKKDGSLNPCVNYRFLNMQTEPDYYLLSNIANVTSYLHKAKIFPMLDLLKGYIRCL